MKRKQIVVAGSESKALKGEGGVEGKGRVKLRGNWGAYGGEGASLFGKGGGKRPKYKAFVRSAFGGAKSSFSAT